MDPTLKNIVGRHNTSASEKRHSEIENSFNMNNDYEQAFENQSAKNKQDFVRNQCSNRLSEFSPPQRTYQTYYESNTTSKSLNKNFSLCGKRLHLENEYFESHINNHSNNNKKKNIQYQQKQNYINIQNHNKLNKDSLFEIVRNKYYFKKSLQNNIYVINTIIAFLFIVLCLFTLANSSNLLDQEKCYYKTSQCKECYSLCFPQDVEDLPNQISQCLIQDFELSIKLDNNLHKNNLNITYLYTNHEQDSCILNSVNIQKLEWPEQETCQVQITSKHYGEDIQQDNGQNVVILNAQFEFYNIDVLYIQNLKFQGMKIQSQTALSIQRIKNCIISDSVFYNNTQIQNNGSAIKIVKNSQVTIISSDFIENFILRSPSQFEVSSGAAIHVTDQSILNFQNCIFQGNHIINQPDWLDDTYGGAIWLNLHSQVQSCIQCKFFNNSASSGGAIGIIDDSIFENCFHCLFDKNTACNNGGAIYLYNSSFKNSFNCSFNENQAGISGGSIFAEDFSLIYNISNSNFLQNTAQEGGAITIFYQSIFENSPNNLYKNNSAIERGGGIHIDDKSIYKDSLNCTFIHNSAQYNGGAISIFKQSQYIYSPYSKFFKNEALYGGAISLSTSSQYLNSNNCVFLGNSAISGGAICSYYYCVIENCNDCLFQENQSQNYGGALFLQQSIFQNSIDCILIKNFAYQGGGIFLTQNSTMSNISNSLYKQNMATFGGALYIIYNSALIESPNCIFENNSAKIGGGALHIQGQSKYINSQNNLFNENIALNRGGAISLYDQAIYSNSSNCIFTNNQAYLYGGAIDIEYNSQYLNSDNCVFENNTASYGGSISILIKSLYNYAKNCSFLNNSANYSGGALYIYNNSLYDNSENFIFSQNSAIQGAAITISKNSGYINSQSATFLYNIAETQGGAISIIQSNYYNIFNSTFSKNSAKQFGGALSIQQSPQSTIQLEQASFKQNQAANGGAIFTDLSCNINLIFVQFSYNIAEINGGAIQFKQDTYIEQEAVQINIKSSQFWHNSANSKNGGAVYFKSEIIPSNISITDSVFQKNNASSAGALYLVRVLYPYIFNNSFISNQAQQGGGAINLTLYGLIFKYQVIQTLPLNKTKYVQYLLYSYKVEKPFEIKNNIFDSNQAGTVAGALLLDYTQAQDDLINKFQFQETKITDPLNITEIYQNEKCLRNNKFRNNSANYGGAALRIDGFNVSELTNNSLNGSCPSLQRVIADAENEFVNNTSPLYKLYSPQEFLGQHQINQIDIMCTCIYGEYLDRNPTNNAYQCNTCPPNTYHNMFQYEDGKYKLCKECPEGFKCNGKYDNLILQPGFWSSTNLSVLANSQADQAYRCNYTNADKICLGQQNCTKEPSLCNPGTVCSVNYTGPACSVCNRLKGYYPQGQDQCLKCKSKIFIIFEIIVAVLVVFVLLYLSLQGLQNTIQQKLLVKTLRVGFDYIIVNRDQLTALLRILTNYFQNLSFFFLVKIDVPEQISALFFLAKSIGQPLKEFSSSFECLASKFQIQNLVDTHRFLFVQFMWMFIIATTIVVFVYLPQYAYSKLTKQRTIFPINLLSIPTCIYLYLVFLPTLFQNSLSFLTCRDIAGKKYIIGDTNLECNFKNNNIESSTNLAIALPIFLFELFVPITLLLLICYYKQKKLLNRPVQISSVKYQLGYFYLGYRDNCFFWEFVRISQRIIIISVFYTLYDFNSQKIGCIALIILTYTILSSYVKPNDSIIVRRAEFFSNITQLYTFISGVVLNSYISDFFQYLFFVGIVVINISFMIYILIKMWPNAWRTFNIFLLKFNFFRKFAFVQKFIVKQRQETLAMLNWLILREKIRQVIQQGCERNAFKFQKLDEEQQHMNEIKLAKIIRRKSLYQTEIVSDEIGDKFITTRFINRSDSNLYSDSFQVLPNQNGNND